LSLYSCKLICFYELKKRIEFDWKYVHGQLCEKLNYSQKACESNPCYNQGLCSPISRKDISIFANSNDDFMCLCPSRHAGKFCQENLGDCSCLNGGTCYNSKTSLIWKWILVIVWYLLLLL